MQNSVRKILPLAIACLLALSGAVFAGDNAGVVLSLTSPTQITGVGPGATVPLTFAAAGMVGVKQFDITVEVSPASAFVLTRDGAGFTPGGPFASAISPGVEVPVEGQFKSGAAILIGAVVSGDGELGTMTLTTAPGFTTSTQATITVVRFSLGPSSSVRDVFLTEQLAMSVNLNPLGPAPTITGISPTAGPVTGGTVVTISGTNFEAGTTVTIGGAPAAATFVDASTLTVAMPAGTAGGVDIVVTNPDGQSATLAGGFTYEPIPAPTVTAIDPVSGLVTGGTAVTITGAAFQDGATVTIGGAAATGVAFVSATSLTAVTPAGTAGTADVVVTNPDGQSATLAGGFIYQAIVEPRLLAPSALDASLDYSAIGNGGAADGSAGEVTFSVRFFANTGLVTAGQEISWAITNNGSEPVFLLSGGTATQIDAGATQTVTSATDAAGNASAVIDAEGGKAAGTTNISVVASTTAPNSASVDRQLSIGFSATWEVGVAAELASFTGSVTPSRGVLLEWTVASQSNNLGWEVYRSTDNATFEKIGDLIAGDGTTDEFKSYSFADTDLPQADVVYYYLKQVDLDGTSSVSQTIKVAAGAQQMLPVSSMLWQNYPNPFNPETTISFDLSASSVVALTVYDLTGQVVRTLVGGQLMQAGRYKSVWDGRDESGTRVSSGVYIYQLRAGDYTSMMKMTLLQ